jgi:hypothetical protein
MSTFFRGITDAIPSLFNGIFSEQNSVASPSVDQKILLGVVRKIMLQPIAFRSLPPGRFLAMRSWAYIS